MTVLPDNPTANLAQRVVRTIHAAGHEAFLVGGCVRDLLRGINPDDFDVATSAPPQAVMNLFSRTIPVGVHFGVVVVAEGEAQVEVATFRADGKYLDGRHPESVRFSSAREDALRRDFTINGMFLDLKSGEVVDYVSGRADLNAGVVRCIGNPRDRFSEDALRLLRSVRFASSLGFSVEPATWAAVCELAPSIHRVSMERIRDEIVKGLNRHNPDRFVELLDKSGLLAEVLPEISALHGCEQPPEFHPEGDVYVHTVLMLRHLPANPGPTLALAALLHDIGKPATMTVTDRIRFNNHQQVGARMADTVMRRLKFSNDDREAVVEMIAHHMDFMNVPKMRESTLRRFLARPTIDEELHLHRADCISSNGDLRAYDFASSKLAEFGEGSGASALPIPLINGHDLVRLGYQPGPMFAKILNGLIDAQIEGVVKNCDAAIDWVRENFPQKHYQ